MQKNFLDKKAIHMEEPMLKIEKEILQNMMTDEPDDDLQDYAEPKYMPW